ncbi:MAG TPA: nucleotidyl transferase AbiEii/AbiGii toxin family protein [Solirubrobacterales bacterium]|nr:nucleotidyl transferase AbiEii/AbiGii toxin family protein [Solirubrobacterales bacterium]
MPDLSLPEKVVAIDDNFKRARIPHAFGGALALAYYAEPRATIDIDINVFTQASRIDDVTKALAPLGIEGPKSEDALRALERDGQCRLWWGRTPVDLFFSYDEIHEAMKEEARKVPFGDHEIEVLAPEHLIVCKACFDRTKDWPDIEQILVSTEPLDVDEARRWLRRAVGDDDPRSQRFDELVTELRGP